MTHAIFYKHRPYMSRKHIGDNIYFEVMEIRVKDDRVECLSRFKEKECVPFARAWGYRWRKVCGKGVVVPSLGRTAIDDHSISLTIRNPITGRMNRVYLRELKKE